MIKISVIIPVYNTEEYIGECLDSLINQTYPNMEIIAIDDGSTDGTLDIMKSYEAQYPDKLKVLTQANQGQAVARNHGLEFATGDYLGFVDSDDWVDKDMYEKMINQAIATSADIVIVDMVDHFPNRTIYHHSSVFDNKFKVTPSACNKLFKRDFVGNVRFPKGLWYEDFCFTTKLLFTTDAIATIHEGLYHCHAREVSTMFNNNSEKNLDMIVILDELKDYLHKQNLWDSNKYVFNYLIVDHVLITTINRVSTQKNEAKNSVIKELRRYATSNDVSISDAQNNFNIPNKRALIAKLNLKGMHAVSRTILNMTAKIKRG